MKQKSTIKHKHHYIPQFFLKRFCDSDENIYLYDKKIGKVSLTKTNKIACENDFYSTNIEGVPKDYFENEQSIVFETKMSIKYNELVKKYERNINYLLAYNCLSNMRQIQLEYELKMTTNDEAFFICLFSYFLTRGLKVRNVYYETYDMVDEILHDAFKDPKVYNYYKSKSIGYREDIKNIQNYNTFNLTNENNMINYIIQLIKTHYGVMCYNISTIPLVSSDYFHCMGTLVENCVKDSPLGYETYGNYIYFPISSKLCIMWFDKKWIDENNSNVAFINNRLEDKQVSWINEEMIKCSKRFIYANEKDSFC